MGTKPRIFAILTFLTASPGAACMSPLSTEAFEMSLTLFLSTKSSLEGAITIAVKPKKMKFYLYILNRHEILKFNIEDLFTVLIYLSFKDWPFFKYIIQVKGNYKIY